MTRADALRAKALPIQGPCWWTYDDRCDSWDTACGLTHQFTTDGPKENAHRFCPYCGRPLKVSRQ